MIWEKESAVAITTALHAGMLLREEWNRGPRGAGEHAFIDAVVETEIRRQLLSFTPDYQYLGEELGRIRGNSPRIWVVDPNDGTYHFLKKRRGASVSIALLDEGTPCVAAVYAYNHPSDRGTLISWAGGQPLRLNGRPIRRDWPLHPSQFLLPQGARKEGQRLQQHAQPPISVEFLPSIAYRLALVAAGRYDTTFTLNHPKSWDIAAGHAMVTAAGGLVYDEANKAICYTPDAQCDYTGGVFAGGRSAIECLSRINLRERGSVQA